MAAKGSSRNLRRGLRKLECGCGAGAYMTFAQLERFGCPLCGSCGERLVPEDLDVAAALGVDAPVIAEYQRALSSVLHGQASHGRRGRELRSAESVAAERIERDRRDRMLSNRLNALKPAVEALPF